MIDVLSLVNGVAELWWAGIVRASTQGGLAFLAVWVIVRSVPRLSPRVRCWFWRLAYLKLFLALFWWSPVELPLLPAPPAESTVMVGIAPERSPLAGFAPGSAAGSSTLPSPTVATLNPGSTPPMKVRSSAQPTLTEAVRLTPAGGALLLWLLGVAWCAQRIGAACRAARLLRGRSQAVEEPSLRGACETLAQALQLRKRPELAASSEVQGPLLLGGRPAAIVLPDAMAERPVEELRLVLAHELAHLRRGDLRWNWLPAAAHALFFFHPLVWIAGGEWRLCQEMACDELALGATRAGAGDYGEMLLKVAASAGRHPRWGWTTAGASTQFLGAVWSDDSPQVLRRRLQMLRYYRLDSLSGRRAGKWSRPTLAGAVIATAGLCLVPWRVTAQDIAPQTSINLAPEVQASPGGAEPGAAPSPAAGEEEAPAANPAMPNPLSAEASEAADAKTEVPSALPGSSDRGALSEQWEDVLLLEAMRYLNLTVAQSRQVHPLSGTAQRRLKELVEQDKRVEASLARIARESRQALLAGQPGTGHREALQLEDTRRRKRARGEEELLDFIVPRLAEVLTREQIIRACLLTIGEPPQDQGRTISPALLNPEAGFVLAEPVVQQPTSTLRDQVNQRLGAVRSRWDERRQAAAKKELAGRYPQKVVDSIANGNYVDIAFTSDATLSVSKILTRSGADFFVKTPNIVGFALDSSEELPEAKEARKEWEALMQRTQVPFAQLLSTEATPDELKLGLRAFARRMFLSPRLRPVLDARLRLR